MGFYIRVQRNPRLTFNLPWPAEVVAMTLTAGNSRWFVGSFHCKTARTVFIILLFMISRDRRFSRSSRTRLRRDD